VIVNQGVTERVIVAETLKILAHAR